MFFLQRNCNGGVVQDEIRLVSKHSRCEHNSSRSSSPVSLILDFKLQLDSFVIKTAYNRTSCVINCFSFPESSRTSTCMVSSDCLVFCDNLIVIYLKTLHKYYLKW